MPAQTTSQSYLARLGLLAPPPAAAEGDGEDPEQPGLADTEPPQAKESLPARVRRITSQHIKVVSVLALVAVIATTWMVMRAHSVPLDTPSPTSTWTPTESRSTPAPPWLVHVMGAVVHPGVVSVAPGARVIDAIEAAGGFTPAADPGELNLAAQLVDGCQIIIGTTTEPLGEVHQGLGGDQAAPGSSSAATTINLNTATAAELESLPGVGPVTAQAILTWRETNGSFASVDQLQEVTGIGPKTFQQIQPFVSV